MVHFYGECFHFFISPKDSEMELNLQRAQIGMIRRRLEKCYGPDFGQRFGMDFSGILRTNFGISDDFDYKERLTYTDESQIEPDIEHADHFENHEQYIACIDNN